MTANRRVIYRAQPIGVPEPDIFGIDSMPCPMPSAGEVLTRTRWLSLDPYLRNVMKGARIYNKPLAPGDVMCGDTVAEVVESRADGLAPGDLVLGANGWQEFAVSKAATLRRLDPTDLPEQLALGVLGMPGLTGYVGMVDLGVPRPGQTVVVSAVTGPVGSTAAQTARLMGARVVGIAGGAAKCSAAVDVLGCDACVDHRDGDLATALSAQCPDGIDVYFDNVGGRVLETVLRRLALRARVVLCGMIEAYNADTSPPGPSLGPVIGARASLHGLVVYDHLARQPELERVVGAWIRRGDFRYLEDVSEGLETAPEAFCRLMRGGNFGKSLVRVWPGKA